MSPLYLKDGKLLLVGNALAGSANCCCGGACCLPAECWVEVTAIFVLLDENGMIVCPGSAPPPPPGYVLRDSFCDPLNGRVSTFRKTLDPDNPQECPADIQAENQTTTAHFQQVSNFAGDPGIYTGGNCCPSQNLDERCEDHLSKAECEAQGGTYHAGKTCAEEPCCCGTPLAPPFPECADTQEILWLQCTNFCDECTCEQVAQAGQYDSCISDIEAILEQQGYSGVAYDEYAATAPDGCGQGQYLYGRDLIACCPGEISGLISDAVPWRAAWDGEPCQWCGILSGAFVKDGTIYVQKCVNPLP